MKTSAIYLIVNQDTGKFYIGRSGDVSKRFRSHITALLRHKHPNEYIQNDYDLGNSFTFIILKSVPNEELFTQEQYYIDELKPSYNISLHHLAPMYGRKHTIKTLKKFKKRKVCKGIEHYNYGRKIPEEVRKKISISHTGSKLSDETKRKMSITARRINSIARIDMSLMRKKIRDNFGNIHESLTAAAKHWNISIQAICDNLKGRSVSTRIGVKFTYV